LATFTLGGAGRRGTHVLVLLQVAGGSGQNDANANGQISMLRCRIP